MMKDSGVNMLTTGRTIIIIAVGSLLFDNFWYSRYISLAGLILGLVCIGIHFFNKSEIKKQSSDVGGEMDIDANKEIKTVKAKRRVF